MSHALAADASQAIIRCGFEIGGIKGCAILRSDVAAAGAAAFRRGMRLLVEDLAPGASLTKYVIVLDEKDTPAFRREAERELHAVRERSYEALLREHKQEWLGYAAHSSVSLPDEWLSHLYRQSLYVVRADQNPYSGLLSLGNYPQLWGGGIANTRDITFPLQALLGANRLAEAGRLIEGYEQVLPLACYYAEQLGERAAY
jgi:hypothetical protein